MPQELREKAQTTDAPSLRHLRTDIFKTLKDKSRLGEPAAVIELRSQARKSSFLTNRLKEMAALQNRRILRRKPRANDHAPSGSQDAIRLSEELFLVLHVLGTLDRQNGIKRSRRQIVLQPIAQE